jgi:hypothetical protein
VRAGKGKDWPTRLVPPCSTFNAWPLANPPSPSTPPRVQTGSCPFVTFTCSEGHTWKASPGTPACFYCPVCRHRTKRVGV